MQNRRRKYNDAAWKRVRRVVLERDGYVCQVRGANCTGVADQVDHIVPLHAGGSYLEPTNLRASCRRCNVARGNRARSRDGWKTGKARIVLVVGPPGAGKSSLVEAEAGPADVVVDYDRLLDALGPAIPRGGDQRHDVTMAARNAVLSKIRKGDVDAETIWIISTNPLAEDLFPHHEVRLVDPGRDQVVAQAGAAGRPPSFVAVIDDWYAKRSSRMDGSPSREW